MNKDNQSIHNLGCYIEKQINIQELIVEARTAGQEAEELLNAGLELFNMGDYETACANFREARQWIPSNDKLQFLYCLSFLAGKPIGSIYISQMNQINNILNHLVQGKDREAASLARIVLGIIRYDYYKEGNYHYQGLQSEEIFKQLENYEPGNEEKELIRHITFSDTAKILFNLI